MPHQEGLRYSIEGQRGSDRPAFVGRTHELETIEKYIKKNYPFLFTLTGPLGSGKTFLINELIRRNGPSTPIAYVDLTEPDLQDDQGLNLNKVLAAAGNRLLDQQGLPQTFGVDETPSKTAQRVIAEIKAARDGGVLPVLIFDSFEKADRDKQTTSWLEDHLFHPSLVDDWHKSGIFILSGRTAILRDEKLRWSYYIPLNLEPFSDFEDLAALSGSRSPAINDHILATTGGLPLFLQSLVAEVRKDGIDLTTANDQEAITALRRVLRKNFVGEIADAIMDDIGFDEPRDILMASLPLFFSSLSLKEAGLISATSEIERQLKIRGLLPWSIDMKEVFRKETRQVLKNFYQENEPDMVREAHRRLATLHLHDLLALKVCTDTSFVELVYHATLAGCKVDIPLFLDAALHKLSQKVRKEDLEKIGSILDPILFIPTTADKAEADISTRKFIAALIKTSMPDEYNTMLAEIKRRLAEES